ncbi:hypothetical protein [Cyanobium sp. Morenito 9A2]|uniref:hypothetical protein n=1 Tax=Cyanobium sp. Morenito 9A2 TaxID=2823718 RepID=UPI0020CE231A|nr:hypothetical protein [Cyanobium sp. Morenito 9A2]
MLTRPTATAGATEPSPAGSPLALASQGVLIGLLTGIAGEGGGFAIVPALVLIALNSVVAMAALGPLARRQPAPAAAPAAGPVHRGGDRPTAGTAPPQPSAAALLTGGEAWQRQHRVASLRPMPTATASSRVPHPLR